MFLCRISSISKIFKEEMNSIPLLVLVGVCVLGLISVARCGNGESCINDCNGKDDGKYQSFRRCNKYENGEMDCTARLVGTIECAGNDNGAVYGVAVLGEEIFVLGYISETIKVYNRTSLCYLREWNISGLKFPGDIKSWTEDKSLFVIDWTKKGERKQMYVVNGTGAIKNQWDMEDDFGRLFLTKETTIVESFHDQNEIAEFHANGSEIRKIKIQKDQGIIGLQHALKLDKDLFVLSHGDPKDDIHRVCLVDGNGTLLKSFGGKKGSGKDQLNVPVYLELDARGNILVADKYNGRIRILNSQLVFLRDLFTRNDGLRYPVKIHLDKSTRLLYVADNNRIDRKMTDGRVMVFKYHEDK